MSAANPATAAAEGVGASAANHPDEGEDASVQGGYCVATAKGVLARASATLHTLDNSLTFHVAWRERTAYTTPAEQLALVPPDGPLEPLFYDDDLIAVSKPAHLPTENTLWIKDSLASRVAARFGAVRVVHRLDWETSGVVVFARSELAVCSIGKQFCTHVCSKQYEAVLHGRLVPSTGVVDLPLGADSEHKPLQRLDFVNGKPSITSWQVLSYDPACDETHVILAPTTGRRHQLRLHCLALGHPIVGDTLYAPAQPAPSIDALPGGPSTGGELPRPRTPARLYLHARELVLSHPRTGEQLVLRVSDILFR
ncbi:pseudouridine synthase [Pavlovales sp. CCMP2436]|nr:pseudouridine synthase [Pavlovales sp. CCMP2436]